MFFQFTSPDGNPAGYFNMILVFPAFHLQFWAWLDLSLVHVESAQVHMNASRGFTLHLLQTAACTQETSVQDLWDEMCWSQRTTG